MGKTTKVVKVPIAILEEDKTLREIKYRALDKVMQEARYLGNMAVRYAIAFKLDKIPTEIDEAGKSVPLDTRIYRILIEKRKYLESGVVATLSRNFAVKMLKHADKDAWTGKKSLPTYRSLFVPFRKQGTKITPKGGQFIIEPTGFGGRWLTDDLVSLVAKERGIKTTNVHKDQTKLVLTSIFSWKDKGAAEIVRRIASGQYSLSDSLIQRKSRGLMIFLAYSFEPEQTALASEIVCGLDLGVVIPAVCAISTGPQRLFIGKGEDIWAARSKFRAERRRQQKRLGHYTKTKRWERSEKEDNWILTYFHTLTRQVIKFCKQQGCGTIHMEDLTQFREFEMEKEFKRLLWVPSKFFTLLKPKAKEQGICLVKVNPRNVYRRCSECGHIAEENRKSQSEFVCVECGDPKRPVNADYNAAKNLALASGDVIINGYVTLGGTAGGLKTVECGSAAGSTAGGQ